MARELTAKQKAFVSEYLVDMNATAAAKRAGYSARTAEWQGPQLLGKCHVAAEIAAAQHARAQRTQIDADWVLRRLHAEATADLSAIFDPDGRLKAITEWPEVFRQGLVTGLEVLDDRNTGGVVRKVKLSDRIKHLEMIGRHVNVGAFRDRIEHTGKDGGPIETKSVVQFYLPSNGR